MAYTSGTRALAALETLVHLVPPVTFRFFLIRLEFEEDFIETWSSADLPEDWADHPPSTSTQAVGDAWARQARSTVLEVPSVIVRSEMNYLINPEHPDFKRITIGRPEPFAFDPRLV